MVALADLPQDVEPREAGHHHVEDGELRGVGLERLPRRQAVGNRLHGIPGLRELELHQLADVGVVVGDEDPGPLGCGHFHCLSIAPACVDTRAEHMCLKAKVNEQTGKFAATGLLFTFWTNG